MATPLNERHNLVLSIMANIGAPKIGDAGAPAPLGDNAALRSAKDRGWVRIDIKPAFADAGAASNIGVREHMEKEAVIAIKIIAGVLDHQHATGKIRFERRPQELTKDSQVEGEFG